MIFFSKKILKNYIEDVIFGAVDILSTGSLLIIIYHMINSCGDFVCYYEVHTVINVFLCCFRVVNGPYTAENILLMEYIYCGLIHLRIVIQNTSVFGYFRNTFKIIRIRCRSVTDCHNRDNTVSCTNFFLHHQSHL